MAPPDPHYSTPTHAPLAQPPAPCPGCLSLARSFRELEERVLRAESLIVQLWAICYPREPLGGP